MRWSDLLSDRARLAVELSKVGITKLDLTSDLWDVPELRGQCELLDADGLLLLALQWFGDEEHPQPEERADHYFGIDVLGLPRAESLFYRTPDWGRLPPLPDDAEESARAAGADVLLEQVLALQAREQPPPKRKPGAKPKEVPAKTKRRIAELRIDGKTPATIMRDTGLSKTVATRLVRAVDDALGKLRAGRY